MIPWWYAPLCATLGLSAGILAGIWLSGLSDEPAEEPILPAEPPIIFPDWGDRPVPEDLGHWTHRHQN